MPRVTKATLEEDIRILRSESSRLRNEIWHFKEVNKFLNSKNFDVDAFCKMHGRRYNCYCSCSD